MGWRREEAVEESLCMSMKADRSKKKKREKSVTHTRRERMEREGEMVEEEWQPTHPSKHSQTHRQTHWQTDRRAWRDRRVHIWRRVPDTQMMMAARVDAGAEADMRDEGNVDSSPSFFASTLICLLLSYHTHTHTHWPTIVSSSTAFLFLPCFC